MDLSNHYPACLLKSLFYKRLIVNRNLIYASSAYHAYILERVNHAVNCCGAYAAVFFGCLIINLLTGNGFPVWCFYFDVIRQLLLQSVAILLGV